MPHGPEHHLEEAEHAQHAAHNPFDRRVALTMAIVAAMLACVTMLSHRAHNMTLQNQIKSNDNITERANVFAYYQAKKNRQLMDEGFAEELQVLVNDSTNSQTKEQAKKVLAKWTANVRKWKAEARKLEAKGKELGVVIEHYAEEAHRYHHRANFFDYGELGVEMALILCSISVLTKSRPFWIAGMVAAGLGFAVAMSGFAIPPPHEEHAAEPEEEMTWLTPEDRSRAGHGGAAATTGLDERIDAQGQKDSAQDGHPDETRSAYTLGVARGDKSPGRGEQTE
jgi:hypothetical protein